MKWLCAALIVLASTSYSAVAQTMEETAAFILLGLEDKASSPPQMRGLTWTRVSPSPAVYEGTLPGDNDKINVAVKSTDGCIINVSTNFPGSNPKEDPMIMYNYTIDLNKITKVEAKEVSIPVDQNTKHKFIIARLIGQPRLCTDKTNNEICNNGNIVYMGFPSPERIPAALSYLQNKFCKRAAF